MSQTAYIYIRDICAARMCRDLPICNPPTMLARGHIKVASVIRVPGVEQRDRRARTAPRRREAVTPRGRLVYAAAVSAGQGHRGAPGRGRGAEAAGSALPARRASARPRPPRAPPLCPLPRVTRPVRLASYAIALYVSSGG